MKKYMYGLIVMLIGMFVYSCDTIDDELARSNIDTKHSSKAPGESLFTNATVDFTNLMLESDVNTNVFRLYAQYWAQTTYPDESQYNQVSREIPDNMWLVLYRDVLKDLQGARQTINQQVIVGTPQEIEDAEKIRTNKIATITIFEVLTYSTLIDIFGNIPYTKALDFENPSPIYDDAATIYVAIIDSLNKAIFSINTSHGGMGENDLFYKDDMKAWVKLANALKLRLGMRLADINPTLSKTTVEAAVANVKDFANVDNFTLEYQRASPNTHPLWVDLVKSGRDDFVPANTLVDVMNTLNDPRRSIFFELKDGKYIGGIYGAANASTGYSAIGDRLKEPTLPGILLSAAEVLFLLAEAAERGYAVDNTAEEYYNNAITASMNEWGVSTVDASAYLAQKMVDYTTENGTWKEKIGHQKWIAMYNIPFEGWTAWRLLDFGILQAPPKMKISDIPNRFLYPIEEPRLNKNYKAATEAIGGDKKSTKIFWDKY